MTDHSIILFVFTNLSCFVSGVALGIAITIAKGRK